MAYYTVTMALRRVAVLAGSLTSPSGGADTAARVGRLLAENGITVLLPPGDGGVRAALCEAVTQAAGRIEALDAGATLAELADGFLALPGALAGLDEVFRLLELQHAGDAEKPFGLLNTSGYFTTLLASEADLQMERFVRETQRGRLIVDAEPEPLLRAMADFRPPETRRFSSREDS